MSFSQIGLILDIIATLILGFESWVKTRGIGENYIVIGHGEIGIFWRILFRLSYPILLTGFVFQYIGSS